jgi:hypothetical protein
MKNLMIAAALCAGMMSAQAQSTPTDNKGTTTTPATTPQKPVTQVDNKDCLRTTEADWKAMGLTADQLTKVKDIQAEHEKACAGMKKDDASKTMMTDKHEARIKEVLTPTQYDAWKKQCTSMADPAKPMEKK